MIVVWIHYQVFLPFSLPIRMYRKSYYTIPDVNVGLGGGIGGSVGVWKMLKFYIKGSCMISKVPSG